MSKSVTSQPIVGEDIFLSSSPSDVQIHLRRKCLASRPKPGGASPVLFVHGATFSGMSAFDAPLPGGSWLDFAAAHGWDAYALDVRGYGLSSRPHARPSYALLEKPYARTDEAITDLGAAVDFILERTGADQVDLVGWSWGTAICGGYTAVNNEKVRSLVLYAPLWVMRDRSRAGLPQALMPLAWVPMLGPFLSAQLGSFRDVSLDDIRRRWFRGLDDRTAESLCPGEVLERWWEHMRGLDPIGVNPSSPVVRAPNGVVADLIEYWAIGTPTYDPGAIKVPVLGVLGEWDIDTPLYMAQELFSHLTATPYKRLEVLGRGTHSMSLEVNRFDLYQRVQQFLETTFVADR